MRPVLSTKFSLLKSRRGGLNSRPTVYETVALPLSYSGIKTNTPIMYTPLLKKDKLIVLYSAPLTISDFPLAANSPIFHQLVYTEVLAMAVNHQN